MTTRRALLAALALSPFAALAQSSAGVRRIGYLAARSRSTPANPEPYFDAFVPAMRDLGYVDGKNLVIEWRFAENRNERLPALAAELVKTKVEVLVTHTTPGTQALLQQTRTIPIVAATMNDPVRSGFAASLARPGGNITGLSLMSVDLSSKQLELLRTMMPALARVAVLLNPSNVSNELIWTALRTVASSAGIETLRINVRAPEDLEPGFKAIGGARMQAVIISADSLFVAERRRIANLALASKLASIFQFSDAVAAGGLMSFGQNLADFHRRAAGYVDRILKGAKPGDLPIEQPTTLHLAINRKTAKALGLTIPQELLLRADEVIE